MFYLTNMAPRVYTANKGDVSAGETTNDANVIIDR